MANDKNQNLSGENVFIKISDILAKYGIDESPVEAMFVGEESLLSKVFFLSKKLSNGSISENAFALELQKANVQKEASEQILRDIKEKVINSFKEIYAVLDNLKNPKNTIEKNTDIPEDISKIPKKPSKKSASQDKYRETVE